jgi:hypothetical protein
MRTAANADYQRGFDDGLAEGKSRRPRRGVNPYQAAYDKGRADERQRIKKAVEEYRQSPVGAAGCDCRDCALGDALAIINGWPSEGSEDES